MTESNHTGLFTLFEQILNTGETFRFIIERSEQGLNITVAPELGKADEDMPEEALKYRAYLARPLFIQEPGTNLDADFTGKLEAYAKAHSSVNDAFQELLKTLDFDAKEITNAANKESGKKKAKTSSRQVKSEAEKPKDEAGVSTGTTVALTSPDSL
jgi:PRTRC genetic system protein E